MDTNIKSQLNFLAKPLVILLCIIGSFIFLMVFGVKQVNEVRGQIAINSEIERKLEVKSQTLESVTKVLAGNVTFLDVVLPSKGAVLYGLSQIKNQALVYGVNVSSLKTGSSQISTDDVSKTSITFDIEGDEQSIYNFLNSFAKLLPLMKIDKVGLAKSSDNVLANVSIGVYSAQLPTKIPALTEAITELTSDEIKILQELAEYQIPVFIEPSVNTTIEAKANPFD